jgi:alpha/beta superfamily hydrolase
MTDLNTVEPSAVSRQDPTTGMVETALYIGSGADRVYGYRYAPPDTRTLGIVLCPAILGDFVTNYRREVLGARSLASRGFPVMRFHYRGTANSDGDVSELSFDTMVEDAHAAAAALEEGSGISDVAFIGTRFGSLIAAAATRSRAARAVALWEPMTDARSYFREMNRTRMMHDVSGGEHQGSSFDDLAADLRANGYADLLGYTLGRRLFESALDRTLLTELGDRPADVLLVQFNLRKGIDRSRQALADALRAAGRTVDLEAVQGVELWGLHSDGWTPIESRSDVQHLLEITTEWFSRRAEGDVA